ncbi:MAG: hypothetical protein ACP5NS_01595 [Candidatus Pacearchaeota archaeon]
MSALKFGLTLGLIGAVTGVFNLANDIPYLRAMAAPGWLVATAFGKACIGTFLGGCSAKQLATTIVAVSVGNGLVYAIGGALIGWGFKALFSSSKSDTEIPEQKTQIVQVIQPVMQAPVANPIVKETKREEKRPQAKAVVSTKVRKK